MNRWRVKMSVEGPLAWLSHLDLLTALERAIRRADLPIRYSEGFNPHMIISWGPAHPVGLASLGEYLDLDFQDSPQDDWQQKLNQYLPMGLSIREARKIPFDMPSLMAAINIAVYQVDLGEISSQELAANCQELLAKEILIVERISPKGKKEVDIRPGILKLTAQDNSFILEAKIGQKGSPKPMEVAALLAGENPILAITRINMFIEDKKGKNMP